MAFLIICLISVITILVIFLIQGYKTSPVNQVSITRYLPCPRIVAWEMIRNIESMPLRRRGIKKIEVLRQHHDEVTECIAHTTHGGYLMLKVEHDPYEHLSIILTASTFGVTGRWDYSFQECGEAVNLTIEENSIIPSFWYRAILRIRGRRLHLEKEMSSILYFIHQKKQGNSGPHSASAVVV